MIRSTFCDSVFVSGNFGLLISQELGGATYIKSGEEIMQSLMLRKASILWILDMLLYFKN